MNVFDVVFGPTENIDWWQECARAALIFIYGLALVRLAGRRVFGKWAALDIVVSMIVGSNLSRALTGNAPLWGTLAASGLLMILHWLLAQGVARSKRFSHMFEGSAIELARGGDHDKSQFLRHAISEGDLKEALRQAGVERVSETRLIALEPSGKITVLRAVDKPADDE
jgi:uncharacterized membrane protein YcaP (DUF421 family)